MRTAQAVIMLRQNGFTMNVDGSFEKDGLSVKLLVAGEAPNAEIRLQFSYGEAQTRGYLNLMIDSMDWKTVLTKAIQTAIDVQKTARAYQAERQSGHYSGC